VRRKRSPEHDFWHPRIEGAILAAIRAHPRWFTFRDAEDQRTCINSIAKRVVGMIVSEPGKPSRQD
jgi:hypothetical protein